MIEHSFRKAKCQTLDISEITSLRPIIPYIAASPHIRSNQTLHPLFYRLTQKLSMKNIQARKRRLATWKSDMKNNGEGYKKVLSAFHEAYAKWVAKTVEKN